MFAPLGDILTAQHGRKPLRTVEPVRRHSRAVGRCEGVFWRRTDREEVRRIVMAARRYELATRQPGARNGALGSVALEIVEAAWIAPRQESKKIRPRMANRQRY